MSLRANIESQLCEIEFIQSLYDNVKISPHSVLEEFRDFVDCKLDTVYNQATVVINLLVEPPLQLEVTLPHEYPNKSLTVLASIRGHSYLQNKFHKFITNLEHDLGTYCISFFVDFLIENCEQRREETAERTINYARLWIQSHHIYDKTKRKNLLQLTEEKSIGGFTLPGKPGVICLEGEVEHCAEAWRVIKSWNWQRIVIKFEERDVKELKFERKYEELCCYKQMQGTGDRPHMDLGLFYKYLENLGLSFAFQELFGIEGK